MFIPERLKDGRIVVPRRAESEDGGAIGDAMVPIGPDDPAYADWDDTLKRVEQIRKEDPEKAERLFGPAPNTDS